MSTLNSRDLLGEILFHPNDLLPARLLSDTGLDVELLKDFVKQLAPCMDYLRGYQPLDHWFAPDDYAPSHIWLKESGLKGKYPYCILALDAIMRDGNATDGWRDIPITEQERYRVEKSSRWGRCARVRVFLTRKREWIVWASYPTSIFRVTSDTDEAVQAISELTLAGTSLYDRGTVSASIVLGIVNRVKKFVLDSNERRAWELERARQPVANLDIQLSRFRVA